MGSPVLVLVVVLTGILKAILWVVVVVGLVGFGSCD